MWRKFGWLGLVLAGLPLAVLAQSGPLNKAAAFYRGTIIASDPSILRDGTGYRMAYTDLDLTTGRTVIAQATSPDGVEWTPLGGRADLPGLVLAGRPGEADENVESASLQRDGTGWRLYYSGYRDEGTPAKGFPAALWLATSTDGRSFARKGSGPVLSPTRGWFDTDAIYSPSILVSGGVWHMIYAGHAYSDLSLTGGRGGVSLIHATSPDGITWTKDAAPIPVPAGTGGWMREGAAEPWLVAAPNGRFLLFFTGLAGEERAIGVASAPSPAGPWRFRPDPLLTPGPADAQDGRQVLAPAVMIEGNRLRLWYLAAARDESIAVGLAEGRLADILD